MRLTIVELTDSEIEKVRSALPPFWRATGGISLRGRYAARVARDDQGRTYLCGYRERYWLPVGDFEPFANLQREGE